MIEANELRIGNIIDFNYKTDRRSYVTLIQEHSVEMEFFERAEDLINGIIGSPQDLIPVPLTEDILIKCCFVGFVGQAMYKQLNNTVITMYFKRGLFSIQDSDWFQLDMPHIKYLHQLQNFVASFSGEELQYQP